MMFIQQSDIPQLLLPILFVVTYLYPTLRPASAQKLPRDGEPFSKWSFECTAKQAVTGITTRLVQDFINGTDLRISVYCQDLNLPRHPEVEADARKCYETEPFILGVDKFGWKHKDYNCKSTEFIQGIYSKWNDTAVLRTMWFKCCPSRNAQMDRRGIGCNSVGPVRLFAGSTPNMQIRNPYEPVYNCPNDVLNSVEFSQDGLSLQYCPMKVKGGRYNLSKCKAIKAASVVKEGKLSPMLFEMLKSYDVVSDEVTPAGKSWIVDCGQSRAITAVQVELVRVRGVMQDMQIKVSCDDHVGRHDSSRLRLTRFVELTELNAANGCRQKEVLQGIISKYENFRRYISLICAWNSNAEFVESFGKQALTIRKLPLQIDAGEGHSIHTIVFNMLNYADSKMQVLVVVSKYASGSASFDDHQFYDEITGDRIKFVPRKGKTLAQLRDEIVKVRSDKAAAELQAKIDAAKAKLAATPEGQAEADRKRKTELAKMLKEFLPYFDTNSIHDFGQDNQTSGNHWRIDCGHYNSATAIQVQRTDQDHKFRISCEQTLKDRKQLATRVRLLPYVPLEAFAGETDGCRPPELLRGIQSVRIKDNRFISLICAEMSNTKFVGRPIFSERHEFVENRKVQFVVPELESARVQTIGEMTNDSFIVLSVPVEITDTAAFTQSLFHDEIYFVTAEFEKEVLGGKFEAGICHDGVLSRWSSAQQCENGEDACRQSCLNWDAGKTFGQIRDSRCTRYGQQIKENCYCSYDHPSGSCLFRSVGSTDGCVCLCNRVCGKLPKEKQPDEQEQPKKICGLGIAYKWLPETCNTVGEDCRTVCRNWKQGIQFGDMITAECRNDTADDNLKCYCEYENICESDLSESAKSPRGMCQDGDLHKRFGKNHCPTDCEQRCKTWVPGIEYVPEIDVTSKCNTATGDAEDTCLCIYKNAECDSCDVDECAAPTPPEWLILDGTFGKSRVDDVIRTRRRRSVEYDRVKRQIVFSGDISHRYPSGVINRDDIRVTEDGDGWNVLGKPASLKVCPQFLCNCDNVCEDWDTVIVADRHAFAAAAGRQLRPAPLGPDDGTLKSVASTFGNSSVLVVG